MMSDEQSYDDVPDLDALGEEEAQALVDKNMRRHKKQLMFTIIPCSIALGAMVTACEIGYISKCYRRFETLVAIGGVGGTLSKALWEECHHLLFGAPHKQNSVEFKVNAITHEVLMEHPKIEISGKKEGGFKFNDDVMNAIMAKFLKKHKVRCARNLQDFKTKFATESWKRDRTSYARKKLNIGLVKNTSTGKVGEKTARQLAMRLIDPQDATNQGRGFMKVFKVNNPTLIGDTIGALENRRENPNDDSFRVPRDLKRFFGYSDGTKSMRLACKIVDSTMALSIKKFDCGIGLEAEVMFDMSHEDLDRHVDSNMHDWHPNLKSKSKKYKLAANLRKYILHMFKDRLMNLHTLIYDGHCAAMPIEIEGETYWADFGVGGSSIREDVYVRDDDLDAMILLLWKVDCPGMSFQHYGSQANNIRPKRLDPNLFFSTAFGIYYNTNYDTSQRGGEKNIKNKKDLESGQYDPAAITVNGRSRVMRQFYATDHTRDDGLGNLTVSLPLVKANSSAAASDVKVAASKTKKTKRTSGKQGRRRSKRAKKTVVSRRDTSSDEEEKDPSQDASDEEVGGKTVWYSSLHQANNVLFYNLTGNRVTGDGVDILKKENYNSWEHRHLQREGKQELDLFAEIKGDMGLRQEDMKEVVNKKKVPQGQCDVDHCLHRSHFICHGVFLCFNMSHTANTCNSITRRWAGDWCFGCGARKYNGGN